MDKSKNKAKIKKEDKQQPNIETPNDDKDGAQETVGKSAEESKIAELEEEVSSLKDKLMRLQAESENYKKRLERDKADAVIFSNQKILEALVPTLDAIDMAVATTKDEGTKNGIALIKQTFVTSMQKWGFAVINPGEGSDFDPNKMEACLFESKDGIESEKVAQTLQCGYELANRVIRAAKVKVYKP